MKKEVSTPVTILIVLVAVGFIGWLAYKNFGSSSANTGPLDQSAINASVNEMKAANSDGPTVPPELIASQAQGMGGTQSAAASGNKPSGK